MSQFPPPNPYQPYIPYNWVPQPQQTFTTQTVVTAASSVVVPQLTLEVIDALILTVPHLPKETAPNTTRQKRTAHQMDGDEIERNKGGGTQADFSVNFEAALFSPQIGGAQMGPSDQTDPELLWEAALRTMQNDVDPNNAFEVVPAVIQKLSTEEVVRIFAKMDGLHLWKRACILGCLNQKQCQEWNSLLFSQQSTMARGIPLKPNPIDADLIQGIRAHKIWKLDLVCSSSSWCFSYLAAYALKNISEANALLTKLGPHTLKQTVNFLLAKETPIKQVVNLLEHVVDHMLVFLVKEIESARPACFESIFAMSAYATCIKIGKSLANVTALSSAKAGLMGPFSPLTNEQKKHLVFDILLSKATYALKERRENSLEKAVEIGMRLKWLEASQIPDLFVYGDPGCKSVPAILEAFSQEGIRNFFSGISDLAALERLALAFQLISPLPAIQGILRNPACQNRLKEVLAGIVAKKLKAAREEFFSKDGESFKKKKEMYTSTILEMHPWLSEEVFSEEERLAILESTLIFPIVAPWKLTLTIRPKSHFIIASQADLNAFLNKRDFSSVQSVWILNSRTYLDLATIRITHESELKNLMEALNKCTELLEVDLRGCAISVGKLKLDVPLRRQENNQIQLRILQQILVGFKSGTFSHPPQIVDIHLSPDSILAGPDALDFNATLSTEEKRILTDLQTVRFNLICTCLPPFSKFSKLEVNTIQICGVSLTGEKLEKIDSIFPHLKEFSWDNTEIQGQIDQAKLKTALLTVRQRCTKLECLSLKGFSLPLDFFDPEFLRQLYAIQWDRIPTHFVSFNLIIDGKKFVPKFSVEELELRSELELGKLNHIEFKDLKRLTCRGVNLEKLREVAKTAPQLEGLTLFNCPINIASFFLFLCEFPQIKQVTVKKVTVVPSQGNPTFRPATPAKIENLHFDDSLANSQVIPFISQYCPNLKKIELKNVLYFKEIIPLLQLPQIECLMVDGLVECENKHGNSQCYSLEAFLQDRNCSLQISPTLRTLCLGSASQKDIKSLTPLLQKRQRGLVVQQKLTVTNARGLSRAGNQNSEKMIQLENDNKILNAFDDHLTYLSQLPEEELYPLISRLQLRAKEMVETFKIALPTVDMRRDQAISTAPPLVVPKKPMPCLEVSVEGMEKFVRVKQALNPEDAGSDVTLFVEGRPIFTHQSILLQVDFFKDWFSKNTSQQIAAGISLSGISYQNFIALLEYFYTAQMPSGLTIEQSCDLLSALEFFFPGKTNQTWSTSNQVVLVDDLTVNDPLAMNLKYQICHQCFSLEPKYSSNIFILVKHLDKLPTYLQRAVFSYLSKHWYKLDLLSEGFKQMSKLQRKEICGIICAGLSKVSHLQAKG